MLTLSYTRQFEKDLALMQKRGKKLEKLKSVITSLVSEEKLAAKFKDHQLTGNYASRRECHIEPDWLLIYKLEENAIVFERTGTHSDLF